jgi:NitT/TauT family transport system substrate-binding protein
MIQPQLDWMLARGYLKNALFFDEQTGEFGPVK